MRASNLFCLLIGAVLAALTFLPLTTAEAQTSSEALYTITLTAIAAVDEPHVVAAQIAAASGGTVETMTEGTVTMRLSPSRARVVATDPRVQSIVPRADGVSTRNIAAEAERMTWSTGVTYGYDGTGNVRQIGTDTFVYDTVGRLVQSHTNGTPRNYEYDAFGNRTKCRESEGTGNEGDCQNGYTIDPANNHLRNTIYDAAGNVTGLGTNTYSYDALNMQTRAAWNSLAREYIYTADDERIAVYEVGQRWRWTVRDTSGKVLREFTSTGSAGTSNWKWTKDYIWRDGLLLASRQTEGSAVTTYHYHLDHLGTPRRITDATDLIVGIHDYFPFGTEQSGAQNEPSLSLIKFTGHERDIVGSESWDTLDYMHARYESASMGRFLSVDPGRDWDLRRPQSWNMYAYVLNNPINRTDPTGKYTCRGSADDCKQIAAALTEARKSVANLPKNSEERARVNAIVNLYGKPGQRNGVVVDTTGKGRIPGAAAGASMQGKTLTVAVSVAAVRDQVSGFATPNVKSELAGVLVHDGQHLFDFKKAGRMFENKAETLAGERRAGFTEAFMWQGLGQNASSEIYTNATGVNAEAIEFYAQRATAMWCAAGGNCQ